MSTVLSDDQTCYLKSLVPRLAEQLIVLDGKPLELERDWQVDLVGSTISHEIWSKARQIGYSYGTALRTLIRAHLFPSQSYSAVLVSINREEAREKIRYVEALYEGMIKKKKTIIANRLEIEFDNGNRIKSFPSNSVRGMPNVDLYLDEFAHIKEARAIYSGSTASTVRQSYGITIGSTPFGLGAFYDIFHGAGKGGEYRHFVAHEVPWWHSHILCNDVVEARIFAPSMRTEERVHAYGNPNLVREFESQPLEVFQVEFESFFQSFGNSVLSQDLIFSCHDADQPCCVVDIDCEDKRLQPIEIIATILKEMEGEKRFTDAFAGLDVGREVHASEFILLNYVENKLYSRLYLTLRKCPYPLQKEIVRYFMDNLPIRKCVIDAQGIGNELAEDLQFRYPARVLPMNFTETSKTDMVGALLRVFEEKIIRIYPTRRMNMQLMAVQKVFSHTGRILYRSMQVKEAVGDKQYKTHADLFWALAMAVVAANDYLLDRTIKTTTRGPRLGVPGSTKSGWSGKVLYPHGFQRG